MEAEQAEERLCLEVSCVFASGVEIESPKAGLDGDAWFVLYPVEAVAVTVAAVTVAAAAVAGLSIDPEATGSAGVGHSGEYWKMIAHGKTIELTSGRWKEIW